MYKTIQNTWLIGAGALALAGCSALQSPEPSPGKDMTFFITSVGPGKGGDLGGLEGADQYCQSLAKAAGAGNRTWRAYLSTQAPALSDPKFVNARDGTAFAGPPFPDMTCGNWTRSSKEGAAMVGHHDRGGPINNAWAISWNSAHPTLGCSQETFPPTGGNGLFYCFAVK